jgi:hypothetical protein
MAGGYFRGKVVREQELGKRVGENWVERVLGRKY